MQVARRKRILAFVQPAVCRLSNLMYFFCGPSRRHSQPARFALVLASLCSTPSLALWTSRTRFLKATLIEGFESAPNRCRQCEQYFTPPNSTKCGGSGLCVGNTLSSIPRVYTLCHLGDIAVSGAAVTPGHSRSVGGYTIGADRWAAWQTTKDEVHEKREADRARMAEWREKKKSKTVTDVSQCDAAACHKNVTPTEPEYRARVQSQSTEPEQDKNLSPTASVPALSPEELIYQEYPRKEGRRKALTAIAAAVARIRKGEGVLAPIPDKRDAQAHLWRRTEAYAKSPAGSRADKTLIPHPSTWFGQGRYLDDDSNWQLTGDTQHGTPRSSTLPSGLAKTSEPSRSRLSASEDQHLQTLLEQMARRYPSQDPSLAGLGSSQVLKATGSAGSRRRGESRPTQPIPVNNFLSPILLSEAVHIEGIEHGDCERSLASCSRAQRAWQAHRRKSPQRMDPGRDRGPDSLWARGLRLGIPETGSHVRALEEHGAQDLHL